jgi:hypothetical protein
MPKPSENLEEHYLPAAKLAADHMRKSIHHLDETIESLKKIALLSGTVEALSAQFDSLSSTYVRLKFWIESHDRQLELPVKK